MSNVYTAREVSMWGGSRLWWVDRNGYAFITNQGSSLGWFELTEQQAKAIAAALNAVEAQTNDES